METVEDESADQVLSPLPSSLVDNFEDPRVLPRIGNEYQAVIPALIGDFNCLEIRNKPADSEVLLNLSNNSFRQVEKFNGKLESGDVEVKVEPIHTVLGDSEYVEEFANLQPAVGRDLVLPLASNIKLGQVESFFCPLLKCWSKIEQDSFLLGLYIFGKNLRLVKRFVESKEMGDILSFYYGKFYTSDGYQKWSECRKLKSRRFIHGRKLFTGWRQKELLSRLFPHVSKACQDMLIESSRYFLEGKISFQEYVFKLKDTVGIHVLIEAVGVGNGKHDLTGFALEPLKNNHVISFHLQVPIGKACSSLTSEEITKFLTGEFRLSKIQSNDLFWEAVWPLLLARGWHSEQRRQSLVFLVPGIKKFSRSLVKGNQYFGSVSDVLKYVASDPGILELDKEAAKGSDDREEDRWDLAKSQGLDDLPTKQQHHYLLPRRVKVSKDLRKFTIVDTAMLHGGKQQKVRALRSLPVQTASLSTPSNIFSETEQDTFEEFDDDAEEANNSNLAEDVIERGVTSNLNAGMPNAPDPSLVSVENHESLNANLLNGCVSGESSCSGVNTSVDRKPTQDESHSQSNLPSPSEGMELHVDSQHFSTASSLEKGSLSESNESSVTENFLDIEAAPEKSQSWLFIDLNLPYVPTDLETDEPFINEMMQNNDNSCANKSTFLSKTSEEPKPLKLPAVGASMEQQAITKSQRQSTRNRPLTTKAWEALELEFFRTKRKRKGETSQNKLTARPQRARGSTIVSAALDDSAASNIADSGIEEGKQDEGL